MYKSRSLNSLQEADKIDMNKITTVIRSPNYLPKIENMKSMLMKDLEKKIVSNEKNDIQFYDIKHDIRMMKKIQTKEDPSSFYSIHDYTLGSMKKKLEQKFYPDKLNHLEKKVLNSIRREKGKFFSLSQINSAIVKDIHKDEPNYAETNEKELVKNLDNWVKASPGTMDTIRLMPFEPRSVRNSKLIKKKTLSGLFVTQKNGSIRGSLDDISDQNHMDSIELSPNSDLLSLPRFVSHRDTPERKIQSLKEIWDNSHKKKVRAIKLDSIKDAFRNFGMKITEKLN